MKFIRMILPAAIVAAGFFATTGDVSATPEMAKKEKAGCTSCHVKPKEKELNEVGKCFKESKNLKQCKK